MPERPLCRIASSTELARVPANERPPVLMQQKRNHLAVLPKPCKTLEARAGAIFARTRKKVPLPGEPPIVLAVVSPRRVTCAPFGAEACLPNMNAWVCEGADGSSEAGRIRTDDPRIRSPMLYPTELGCRKDAVAELLE